MSETCEYCGSPLGFSPMGDYCTNEECSYIDGHYSGPRQKRPAPERTFSESDLRLAREKAYREAAAFVKKWNYMACSDVDGLVDGILAHIDQPALDQHDEKIPKGYLNQHCLLCGNKPVRYVKTKGGFHKVCDLCAGVLEMAGLLIEPDRIHAMKVQEAGNDK